MKPKITQERRAELFALAETAQEHLPVELRLNLAGSDWQMEGCEAETLYHLLSRRLREIVGSSFHEPFAVAASALTNKWFEEENQHLSGYEATSYGFDMALHVNMVISNEAPIDMDYEVVNLLADAAEFTEPFMDGFREELAKRFGKGGPIVFEVTLAGCGEAVYSDETVELTHDQYAAALAGTSPWAKGGPLG